MEPVQGLNLNRRYISGLEPEVPVTLKTLATNEKSDQIELCRRYKNVQYISVRTNVTLRRIRVTTVAVVKQSVLNILRVCSLRHAARQAHASYHTVICGLSDSTIFFHINW
jgi:D-alanyl-D-alanine dipeptidase